MLSEDSPTDIVPSVSGSTLFNAGGAALAIQVCVPEL